MTPLKSAMSLVGDLNTESLYISLSSRAKPGEYHWGIVITDPTGGCTVHHASNRDGPWHYEVKYGDPSYATPLITLLLLSDIQSHDSLERVIKIIPANGHPSERTGEAFNCRTWVKDALVALDESGSIVLPTNIELVEQRAIECGIKYADMSESGQGATVDNDPFGLRQG